MIFARLICRFLIFTIFNTNLNIFSAINMSSEQSTIFFSDKVNSRLTVNTPSLQLSTGSLAFTSTPTLALLGNGITFSASTLDFYDLKISFSASLSGSTLSLAGSQSIILCAGQVAPSIAVSGTNNRIAGTGNFSGDITLADSASVLTLAVASSLDVNINLNGGTIILATDLSMGSGMIVGPGTINLNGNVLEMGPAAHSTALTFNSGGTVKIRGGNSTLAAAWTFSASASAYRIFGQSCRLTLLAGGSINFSGTTTNIIGYIAIDGLTSTGTRKITLASGQTLQFWNTELALVGNYTHSAGTLAIMDSRCLFSTKGFSFTISGATSILSVVRNVLFFDNLSTSQTSPIVTAAGGTISLTSSAVVRSATRTDGTVGTNGTNGTNNASAPGNATITTTTTLTANQRVDNYRKLFFSNPSPPTVRAITFNGNGANMLFANTTFPLMTIDQYCQITFTAICLQNFNPACASFGVSANAWLGSGAFVDLAEDWLLDASSPVWYAVGTPIISGRGYKKIIFSSDSKLATVASSNLTLKDAVLVFNTTNPLAIAPNSTVTFQDCRIVLDNTITLTSGSLNFSGFSSVITTTNFDSPVYFQLKSTGTATVLPDSALEFQPSTGLHYEPIVTSDLNLFYRKRHFVLTDYSSKLILNGASLVSTTTGLALDNGNLWIKGSCKLIGQGSFSSQLQLANTVVVNISAGAELIVTGSIQFD